MASSQADSVGSHCSSVGAAETCDEPIDLPVDLLAAKRWRKKRTDWLVVYHNGSSDWRPDARVRDLDEFDRLEVDYQRAKRRDVVLQSATVDRQKRRATRGSEALPTFMRFDQTAAGKLLVNARTDKGGVDTPSYRQIFGADAIVLNTSSIPTAESQLISFAQQKAAGLAGRPAVPAAITKRRRLGKTGMSLSMNSAEFLRGGVSYDSSKLEMKTEPNAAKRRISRLKTRLAVAERFKLAPLPPRGGTLKTSKSTYYKYQEGIFGSASRGEVLSIEPLFVICASHSALCSSFGDLLRLGEVTSIDAFCAALPNEEKVQTAGGRGQEPTTPVLPEHMVGVIYYVTYAAEGLARRDARYTGAGGSADAAPDDESD